LWQLFRELPYEGLSVLRCKVGWKSDSNGQTIFGADADRGDAKRFIVHADDKLSAFVELERQMLTVTFYLESIYEFALVINDGKLRA
jgi:hypothetical protein